MVQDKINNINSREESEFTLKGISIIVLLIPEQLRLNSKPTGNAGDKISPT